MTYIPADTQLFAAVCGNFHILDDQLDAPVSPGQAGVPRLCPSCSAPVYTRCTTEGCDAPIRGYWDTNVIVMGRSRRADWFCQACGRPYLWATPEQVRSWIENRLKFDSTLDEDQQFELIETLAVMTPGEPDAQANFSRFRDALKLAPDLYREVKPYLPMLLGLVHKHP